MSDTFKNGHGQVPSKWLASPIRPSDSDSDFENNEDNYNDDLFEICSSSEEENVLTGGQVSEEETDGQVSGRNPLVSMDAERTSNFNVNRLVDRRLMCRKEDNEWKKVFHSNTKEDTDCETDEEIPEEIETVYKHKQGQLNKATVHHVVHESEVAYGVIEKPKRIIKAGNFMKVDVVLKTDRNSTNDRQKGFKVSDEGATSGTKYRLNESVGKPDIFPKTRGQVDERENKLPRKVGQLQTVTQVTKILEATSEVYETTGSDFIQSLKDADAKIIPEAKFVKIVQADQQSQSQDSSFDRKIECQPKEKINYLSDECPKPLSGKSVNEQIDSTKRFKNFVIGRHSYDYSHREEIVQSVNNLAPVKTGNRIGVEQPKLDDGRNNENNNTSSDTAGKGEKRFQDTFDRDTRPKERKDITDNKGLQNSTNKPYIAQQKNESLKIQRSLSDNRHRSGTSKLSANVVQNQIDPTIGNYEHYWKLLETGSLTVPNCADIKLMEYYFIVSADSKIIKKCRKSEEMVDSMKLEGAGSMCCIKKSARIAVIQTPSFITCLETHPRLSVVYKIETNRQYTSICHLETYDNPGVGLPNPRHVFATIFTKIRQDTGQWDEGIMRVTPKQDVFRARKKPPVYTEEASEIQLPQVSKMCSLHSVWRGGIHLVVGCYDSVSCIRVADKYTVWKTLLDHSATDVTFMDPNILVCVQDEHRIAAIDYKSGKEVIKNLFDPTDAKTVSPHKISVCRDSVLMKSYSNDKWRMLTIIEHS